MTQTTETTPTYIIVQAPPAKKRRVPMWLWAVVVAVLIAGAGMGTFASFSASTTNNSSFSTGSLVLSDKVNAGTACLSSNGTGGVDTNSNTTTCDAAFSFSTKKPGDSGTATIDIKDDGTIDGAHLKVYASSACAAANASGESYHGTGDPCGSVEFYVQEWSNSNHTGALTCLYGGGTASTCAFDSSHTLADFSATYTTFGNGVDLSGLTAGSTRYFTVGVQLISTAGNNMQGRSATMPLVWYLQQ